MSISAFQVRDRLHLYSWFWLGGAFACLILQVFQDLPGYYALTAIICSAVNNVGAHLAAVVSREVKNADRRGESLE